MTGVIEAFEAAVRARDESAMQATLHPDVVFSSPAVFKPYQGREATMTLLRAVMAVFEDFEYFGRADSDGLTVLRFRANVGGRSIEGVDVLEHADGAVTALTVLIRPLSGLHAVVEAMGAMLAQQAVTAQAADPAQG